MQYCRVEEINFATNTLGLRISHTVCIVRSFLTFQLFDWAVVWFYYNFIKLMIQVYKNRAFKKEIVIIVFCYQYSSFKLKLTVV